MTDRSLEERIQRRILVEAWTLELHGVPADVAFVATAASAARIAALEVEDSYRDQVLAQAVNLLLWQRSHQPKDSPRFAAFYDAAGWIREQLMSPASQHLSRAELCIDAPTLADLYPKEDA